MEQTAKHICKRVDHKANRAHNFIIYPPPFVLKSGFFSGGGKLVDHTTSREVDEARGVWSRLVRVAPRWWCRWRRTGGVIAGDW